MCRSAGRRQKTEPARARRPGLTGAGGQAGGGGVGDGPGIAVFAIASAAIFASLQGIQRSAAAPRPGPHPAPLRGANRAAVAPFARLRGPAERVLTRGQTRPMPATAPRRLRPVGGRVRAWRWGGAGGASPEDEAGAFIRREGRRRARPGPPEPPSALAATSAGSLRAPVTYLPSQCLTSDLPVTYQ